MSNRVVSRSYLPVILEEDPKKRYSRDGCRTASKLFRDACARWIKRGAWDEWVLKVRQLQVKQLRSIHLIVICWSTWVRLLLWQKFYIQQAELFGDRDDIVII